MQTISASIVILAGAICLCGGAFAPESIRGIIVMGTGGLLILVGLFYWVISLAPPDAIQDDMDKKKELPES